MFLRDHPSEQRGIDAVRLRSRPQGFEVMPRLHRIQEVDGMALGMCQIGQQLMIRAGRFETKATPDRSPFQPGAQRAALIPNLLNRPALIRTGHDDRVFGDIDSHIQNGFHPQRLHNKGSLMGWLHTNVSLCQIGGHESCREIPHRR